MLRRIVKSFKDENMYLKLDKKTTPDTILIMAKKIDRLIREQIRRDKQSKCIYTLFFYDQFPHETILKFVDMLEEIGFTCNRFEYIGRNQKGESISVNWDGLDLEKLKNKDIL